MMRSLIIEALSQRADVTLVGTSLSQPPDSGRIDVVVMPTSDPEDLDGLINLLWRWRTSRIVAVATSGRLAVTYEVSVRKLVLGDVCSETLVEAVCH